MPWARFDDRFPSNRKVRLLSDGAFRLYVSSICWSAENLTDGVIKTAELRLVADVRAARARAKELVEFGLWEELPRKGWLIHDYHEYNPTAEQVRADRAAKTARQQRWREKNKKDHTNPEPPDDGADVDASTDASRDASRDGSGDAAPSRPAPTRPEPQLSAGVNGGGAGSSEPGTERPDGLAPIDADQFALTDAMRRWAKRDGYSDLVDIDHATAQFVSHYRSTGARRSSWPDAWQKWIRDDAKRAAERRQRPAAPGNVIQLPTGQTLTGTDATVAGWAALAASLDDEESA